MADKKKGLSFLQLPIPPQVKRSKVTKRSWTELNMRQTVDSGALSCEKNISTEKFPFLVPSRKILNVTIQGMSLGKSVSGIHGFDDFLIICHDGKITRVTKGEKGYVAETAKDSTGSNLDYVSGDKDSQRSVLQFNVFNDEDGTSLNASFDRRIIIFPDKVALPYSDKEDFVASTFETEGNAIPNLKYATVHLSRVFGVDDSRVYASAFNDYSNWVTDTADEYNEANAWFTASQSNSKADGNFTGITTFQSHVVCFKKDFMHEIYNTKNPFRIQDIYAEGAIDNRTICDVDGQLIFCSEDGVKVYTGGNPRIISYNLGIDRFYDAVAGTDGRCYYLYCKDKEKGGSHHIFVYDTYCGLWSEREAKDAVVGFAKCNFGFFCLDANGNLCKMDTSYEADEWEFETDLMTTGSCDIKHVDKLQMCCDIDVGSSVVITMIDEKGTEQSLWTSGGKHGYVVARVKIRKSVCNAFKIRVSGTGNVCIRSMELFIKQGGELYESWWQEH